MATETYSVIEGDGSSNEVTLTSDPVEDSTVQAVKDAIGDETAASEERDAGTSATQIERLTAVVSLLMDVLAGGDATDRLRVGIQEQDGDLTVTLDGEDVSIDQLPSLPAGGNKIGSVDISSFPSALVNNNDEVKTTASVNVGSVELEADDSQGNGVVPLWREDGTNYLGVVDKSQIDEGNNSIRSFSAKSQTAAFDSLNATTQQVKASAGEIADLHFTNPNTSLVYLKVWFSTGNTAGTDDADAVYGIPAESGFSPHFDSIEAASGIEVAATANPALSDGTSLSTPIAGTVHYR